MKTEQQQLEELTAFFQVFIDTHARALDDVIANFKRSPARAIEDSAKAATVRERKADKAKEALDYLFSNAAHSRLKAILDELDEWATTISNDAQRAAVENSVNHSSSPLADLIDDWQRYADYKFAAQVKKQIAEIYFEGWKPETTLEISIEQG